MALLAVVADKAVVDTTPHLAHLRVSPVCGSLICLQGGGGMGGGDTEETHRRMTNSQTTGDHNPSITLTQYHPTQPVPLPPPSY